MKILGRNQFGQALSEIDFWIREPPENAACALVLLFVAAAVAEAEAAQCSVAGEEGWGDYMQQ